LYQTRTVGLRAGPIASREGPHTVVDTTFDEFLGEHDAARSNGNKHRKFTNILLIPGGMGTRTTIKDEKYMLKLKECCARSDIVATVCTGAALLAWTGILDGRTATTNKRAFDWVQSVRPKVRWQYEPRFVSHVRYEPVPGYAPDQPYRNGSGVVTSAGVSAGTDMAMSLISNLHGKEIAEAAASRMEYAWNEDAMFDPFSKK